MRDAATRDDRAQDIRACAGVGQRGAWLPSYSAYARAQVDASYIECHQAIKIDRDT